MNPLRILLTINNLDTAGGKYLLADIARGLDAERFSVRIGLRRSSDSKLERSLGDAFPIDVLPLRLPRGAPWRLLTAQRELVRHLRGNIDVVHSFDYSRDWFEAFGARVAGVPFIAQKQNLSFSSWRWRPKLTLATKIVCLSRAQRIQLAAYEDKLSTVPPGIDLERFATAQAASRGSFDISGSRVVAICVAHLVDVKGYRELISALGQTKQEFPDLLVLCVGTGNADYLQQLRRLAVSEGVQSNIRFLGASNQVPDLLKLADFQILATQNRGRREGFGVAIVEGMAVGLPVLATRSGGPEDIVVDGETGWLVAADGPTPLAQGIRRVFADRERWPAMARAALDRARKCYGRELMVRRYSELYSQVTRRRP